MRPAKTVDELTQQNVETIAAMDRSSNEHRTRAERIADVVAASIGSWPFIIIQSVLLIGWIILNVTAWIKHWDPYPFILLNLGLSFQAAYASPIIMMSQNRQARLDERRNHLDLQINLLSEQENTEMLRLLRKLCDKLEIDHQDDPTLEVMEQTTQPKTLVEQIEHSVEASDKSKGDAQKP